MIFPLRRFLSPALRSKRWLLFLGLGVVAFTQAVVLGLLFLLAAHPAGLETARSFPPAGLALAGFSSFLIAGFWLHKGFNNAFQSLSLKDQETSERLREFVFQHKRPDTPPGVVALGGGTGLSSLLKGLKELQVDVTAVVTVTDDGGSSGRLRKELSILPPGDIRNCLVALSRSESLLSRLFQFRFEEGGEISGHSFGNLFIAAMTNLLGDFGSAVREASNILAIKGQVIPVTCENVQLSARFEDESEVIGETGITHAGKKILSMALHPPNALANPEALTAIDRAKTIILGPGSLFTSIIPNLLVADVAERINRSSARIVYVCNIMTQPGETDRFTAVDHVTELMRHTSLKRIDYVVVNSRRAARPLMAKYEIQGQHWVPPTVTRIEEKGIRVLTGDFLLETDLVRHDSNALATLLYSVIND
jgi:uncharacterized cofD-like protein